MGFNNAPFDKWIPQLTMEIKRDTSRNNYNYISHPCVSFKLFHSYHKILKVFPKAKNSKYIINNNIYMGQARRMPLHTHQTKTFFCPTKKI